MDVTRKHKKVKRSKENSSNTGLLKNIPSKKGKCEGDNVGQGYAIGDTVWGRVKSHPWWPGHVFDESLASVDVRNDKREWHDTLVAFYGDGAFGWFKANELIPFDENFNEKSRKDSALKFVQKEKEAEKEAVYEKFVNAVEEAVTEVSRRRSIGLACSCRNQFNFLPSSEGHVLIDVGDDELKTYSLRQVREAQDSFQPEEMLSFITRLALTSKDAPYKMIQFKKNMATALAYRKALYEEFDEPYAEAFGQVPVRPPRPTAPFMDPSKAPLSGTVIAADTSGKGKATTPPITQDQLGNEVYENKWRDGPRLSRKEAPSGQVQRTYEGGGVTVGGGKRKAKTKCLVGELSSENGGLVETKKNKKKMKTEISANIVQVAVSSNSSAKAESASGKSVHVSRVKDTKSFSSSVKRRQEVKIVEGGKKQNPPYTIKEMKIRKKP